MITKGTEIQVDFTDGRAAIDCIFNYDSIAFLSVLFLNIEVLIPWNTIRRVTENIKKETPNV